MGAVQSAGPRGAATAVSIAGIVAGLAGLVIAVVYLEIRPPCPPGYVRLLDVARAVPWASGFLAVAAGSCLASAMPSGRHRLVVVTGSVVAAVAVGLLVVSAVSLARAGDVGTCWAS